MNKFKTGDVVRVKEDQDLCEVEINNLSFDREYIVQYHADDGLLYLENDLAAAAYRFELVSTPAEKEQSTETKTTQTGGSTPNQYRISINLPLTSDRTKFIDVDLEAMDVIDALDLSGNLKDVQKALFRMGKKDGTPEDYDFNKCIFFLLREMKKRGIISHGKFWEATKAIDEVLSKGE